tara:strand:- start:1252 stop:1632 length:381 start_codon:yes stop_codon:yes gene_type:complete
MKLSEERKFGIIFIIIFSALDYYAFYKNNFSLLYIFSLIIIFFLFSVLFKDSLLSYLMNKWIKFGMYISKVMNPIIMFLIYILTIIPISIIMRLFRVDLLKLKKDDKSSYWKDREDTLPNNMDDQF